MDITEYFKQFEAKWWQEESEVFIDEDVIEELGTTFKVDQKSLKVETAQLEETNDPAKPMQETSGKSLPTLQIIFRCLAECESYNFQTLDEIRLYAQQPYMMEKEYKDMLQSMWNKYASSKQTMNAIQMSKMLTFILKKELKEGEKLLDTIGKAKARLEMGVKKACTREINHAKSRSSNSKFVEQQFTEQKDEILETLDKHCKEFKVKSLSELKTLQRHIYKYFLSNIEVYSEELLHCIAKFTKSEYQVECPVLSCDKKSKDSKETSVISFEQFFLGFVPCIDTVISANRCMVDQGYLFPNMFEFVNFQTNRKIK